MANKEQLKLIKGGVETWNAWRQAHPSIRIDLSSGNLSGMNLPGIDLAGANLQDVNFNAADLSDARLSGANLSESSLMAVSYTHLTLPTTPYV